MYKNIYHYFNITKRIQLGGLLVLSTFLVLSQKPVITSPMPPSYDISSFTHAGVSEEFTISGQEGNTRDLEFNPDGTKMYITGFGSDAVHQYDLSTPFDVSTASYITPSGSFFIATQEDFASGVEFNDDGTRMYIVGTVSDSVHEYILTTPYDISTASFNVSFSVQPQASVPTGLTFRPDGSEMFIVDASGDKIITYGLGIAFDLSTASHSSLKTLSISSEDTNPTGLSFNSDGTKLFIVGQERRAVAEYTLSTAYDVTSASFLGPDDRLSVTSEENVPSGIEFNASGTKMFISGLSGDAIVEYQSVTLVMLEENSEEPVADVEANDGMGGENDISVSYSLSGDDAAHFEINSSGIISFNTPPDFDNPVDANLDNEYDLEVVVSNGVDQSEVTLIISVEDVPEPVFTSVGDGFDLGTASYAGLQEEFSVSAQEGNPQSLVFSADGSKMFVLGQSADDIFQYDLTSPFDVSKATYSDISLETNDGAPADMVFTPDGLKLFTIGNLRDRVSEYHLSAAFDLSTAIYQSESEEFDFSTEVGNADGFGFNNDGSKMIILEGSGNMVEYDLSTGYDVSTAVYAGSEESFLISEVSFTTDFTFNGDGKKMFVVSRNDDVVAEYNLATPYDISTAIYAGVEKEFSVASEEAVPSSVTFSADGTRMYIIGDRESVIEYQLSSSIDYTEGLTTPVINIDTNNGMGGSSEESITYDLEGIDAVYFSLGANGTIRFNTAPDFENPQDANADNVYEIILTANNGIESSSQNILISVQDAPNDAPVITSPLPPPFTVSSYVYTGTAEDFSFESQEENAEEIIFDPTGTKMFTTGGSSSAIHQYTLSEAFDVSTASYISPSGSFSLLPQDDTPLGIAFSPDGTMMYITGRESNSIYQYHLSSAYDISTSSYQASHSLTEGSRPSGVDFNQTGLKMFISFLDDDAILEYTLSEAFDISTASYSGDAEKLQEVNNPQSLTFSPDGLELYTISSSRDVTKYEMSVPFDISTANPGGTEVNNFSEEASPTSVRFNSNGTKMFIAGNIRNTVKEYQAATQVDFNENSTEALLNVEANDGLGGGTDENITYTLDGQDASRFMIGTDGLLTFNTPPNFENPEDADRDNIYHVEVVVSNGVGSASLFVIVSIQNEADTPEFTFTGEGTYDVSTGIYAGNVEEFYVGDRLSNPSGLDFSADGSRMYVLGDFSDLVVEYVLTTPFDVSSSVYSTDFFVGGEDSNPEGLTFNSDGSVLYIIGATGDAVVEYDLSIPYDLSTATYAGIDDEFFFREEDQLPTGLAFSSDGSVLLVIGNENDEVIEYHLSTPYDVSTATYAGIDEEFSIAASLEPFPSDIEFDPEGTRMFISGTSRDVISEYHLETAYDVSTAVFAGAEEGLSVRAEESSPEGFAFDSDGTKLFVTGAAGDAVVEYRLATQTSYEENSTGAVIDINANDGQGGTTDASVTYNLEGEDASLFSINGDGQISFSSSPDFENPQDFDTDNVYDIDIVAENSFDRIIQQLLIRISNVAPVFSSGTAVSIAENSTGTIYTVVADEASTFSLGSSKDEGLFTMISGELSFTSPPDFENPLDSDENNVYLVDVVATDGAGSSTTLEVAITVLEADEIAPVITSLSSLEIEENTSGTVYTATADEPVTFALGSAKDEDLFSLDNDEISFIESPDFENPMDANTDNVYLIDLIATDLAGNQTTLEVAIGVLDVDDTAPIITSGSAINVEENTSGTIYSASADEEAAFTLGTAKDEALFRLDIDTDDIRFIVSPDFENPQDLDNNNVYLIDLTASDEAGNSTTVEVAITVTDLDEIAPSITSPTSVNVEENLGGVAYTATADESVVFSLGDGKDGNLFELNNDQISFIESPDFENPQDDNTDNVYLIDLAATDDAGNSSTIEVSITVTDKDEIVPTITSATAISVDENFDDDLYLATADETVTFTLGSTKDEDLFILQDNEINFITSPDFENPLDLDEDNVYRIDLTATDEAGNSTTVEITVTVTDVDEIAPVITSPSAISVVENTFETIYTAEADETVTFALGRAPLIVSAPTQGIEKDEDLFSLDGNEISFINAPDFENPQDLDGDNVYQFDLVATDEAGNETILEIAITVTDLDEIAPTITSASSISIEENSSGSVYTATADEAVVFSLGTELDLGTELTITLATGHKDENLFNLEGDQISFIAPPDFENPQDLDGDNIYRIDLVATDEAGNFSTIEVAITVTDIDEIAPIITSASSLNVEENFDGIVYTATANETVTFSLGQTKDENLFLLNDDRITFLTSPDFENPRDGNQDNVYVIDLIATDLAGNESTLEVAITVTDLEDGTPPSITSPSSVVIDENQTGTIYTASANEAVTFSLGGLKDEALFILDGDGIRFINAPDFENPQDADGDNTYLIDLTAVNESGNSATLEVSISVQDVDEENPVITSPSTVSIEENVSGRIYTATANETVTFSLGSDKDEALFLISENLIAFVNAPDFENPLDEDEDNIYLIDLVATDEAGNVGTLEVAITVTDVDDQVLSTVDEIALSFYPNPASEWVTVEGPEIIDRVSFFDLNGKRILEQKVRKIKTQIDVSGLPAGMYLMIVEMNGKKTEERFIKK